ncbi:transketolase family protein [Clostridium thermosuccinogenes]|uniref:transketolase family protein n=1 Tax=Clostridium thermosuccinogenes TaxID=84032 RepID=UPI003BEED75E
MLKSASFRDALGKALVEMGKAYQSMVVITPDLAKAVRITEYKKLYPERFISVGISEADCISVAAGLATVGLIPVVTGFAMFVAEKPFEQIRNSISYPCLNVKIFATHGGISVGRDGATHQAIEDIAIMRTLPNFSVITAVDATETKAAIKAALKHKGPVYLRLGRDQAETIYNQEKEFVIGQCDVLKQGKDATIIACGLMVAEALKAESALREERINVRVINMHSIKPLDEEAVMKAALETGAIVTAEDHTRIGGLGGAVAEMLVRNCPVPMEQVAVEDCFAESGSQDELYQKYGLTADRIVEAVKKVMARKNV